MKLGLLRSHTCYYSWRGINTFLFVNEISLPHTFRFSYRRSLLPMRSSLSISFVLLGIAQACLALPSIHPRAGADGVIIVPPPNLSNQTGLKQIPGDCVSLSFLSNLIPIRIDDAHPFRAPGPGDQRGPCRKSDSRDGAHYPSRACDSCLEHVGKSWLLTQKVKLHSYFSTMRSIYAYFNIQRRC